MRRFDGILIDFYGTICAGDRDAVERVCGRIVDALGLSLTSRELAISWGEVFFALLDRSNHGEFRTLYECELQSLCGTLASLEVNDDDPARFLADLEAYWADPPVHSDALEFLDGIDLPVCCVSNADRAPLMAAVKKHGLEFDAVVCSEDARCYKPQAAIFKSALDLVGLKPERTLHIGDSLHSDVGGAIRLGMSTAWIRRENRIHDIGTCRPSYTFTALGELSPLLADR